MTSKPKAKQSKFKPGQRVYIKATIHDNTNLTDPSPIWYVHLDGNVWLSSINETAMLPAKPTKLKQLKQKKTKTKK